MSISEAENCLEMVIVTVLDDKLQGFCSVWMFGLVKSLMSYENQGTIY